MQLLGTAGPCSAKFAVLSNDCRFVLPYLLFLYQTNIVGLVMTLKALTLLALVLLVPLAACRPISGEAFCTAAQAGMIAAWTRARRFF